MGYTIYKFFMIKMLKMGYGLFDDWIVLGHQNIKENIYTDILKIAEKLCSGKER